MNKRTDNWIAQKLPVWLLPTLAVALVVANWLSSDIVPNNFNYDVQPWWPIPFFETHYIYMYMHLLAAIPVVALSFDKKVAYYKTWPYLFKALLAVAVIFWVWDIAKTYFQVWGFNPNYYTALLINLPIEEWLFFITFPFCSVFIYECLNAYFPSDWLKALDRPLSMLFGFGFLAIGLLWWQNSYTATTWIPAGIIALWHYFTFDNVYRTKFYRAFFIDLIPFYLINSVWTGATTRQPVVIYNEQEYFGIRVGTVPIDDFVYNFLLQFMVIILFEYFRNRRKQQ